MDVIQTITLCINGDDNAWREFITYYGPIARNICRKFYQLTDEDIDNVTQNVFIKLINGGLAHFQGTTRYEFLAYFKTTVVNEAKTYLKAEAKWKLKIDDSIPFPIELGDCLEEAPSQGIEDQAPRPDMVAEQRQTVAVLMDILKTSPITDQQLVIYKMKEYKDKEISELLNIPMGTVASKYSRIISRIKEEFRKRGVS